MKKLLSAVLALAMAGAVMTTPALAEETKHPELGEAIENGEWANSTANVFKYYWNGPNVQSWYCISGIQNGKTLDDAVVGDILVFPDVNEEADGQHEITYIGINPFTKETGALKKKVTTIHFPEKMTVLECGSLKYVGPVETVTVPSRVFKIGSSAFQEARIKNIEILGNSDAYPEIQYTVIESGTFKDCTETETISLPSYIKQIDKEAFAGCSVLREINFAGTQAQWNNIKKAQGNEILGCVNVVCSDGTIEGSHDWVLDEEKSTPATCVAIGTDVYVCSKCRSSKQGTTAIDSNNHVSERTEQVTAATCTESGHKDIFCGGCNVKLSTEEIPATGHKWDEGKVTTEPTTSAEGEKTFTCTLCGATRTEAVAKLEHYTVLEGKEQTVEKNGNEPTFRFDIPFAHFHELRMDGQVVDPADYTAWEGSTYVRLNSSYLASLSNGSHTMTAVDDNGVTVDAVFTVQTPTAPESEHPEIAEAIANGTWGVPAPTLAPTATAAPAATAASVRSRSSIPQTVDESSPALAVVLMLVSLLGMAGVAMHRRRQ